MQELFKEIPGYKNYLVSNLWRVKTLNFRNHSTEAIMFIEETESYSRISLTIEWKRKHIMVHRLVALAFIPNPENKPQVNHIDWNKHNNMVSNLEWVTVSENVKHSYRVLGQKPTKYWTGKFWENNFRSKPIEQYTKLWDFVGKFFGISEACRLTWVNNRNISSCCRGKLRSAGGFVWKYQQ